MNSDFRKSAICNCEIYSFVFIYSVHPFIFYILNLNSLHEQIQFVKQHHLVNFKDTIYLTVLDALRKMTTDSVRVTSKAAKFLPDMPQRLKYIPFFSVSEVIIVLDITLSHSRSRSYYSGPLLQRIQPSVCFVKMEDCIKIYDYLRDLIDHCTAITMARK